jgi:hypothetical protein
MTLLQQAVLCATLDMREGDDANFVEWHTREHLVERLAIPGFLRGRRFVREKGSPRYLILYDVESLAVLSNPVYVGRLNNPTPWTRATLPTFQNGKRSAYQIVAQDGCGEGGFLMMARIAPVEPERVKQEIERAIGGRWCGRPGVVRISFATPDQHASTLDTEESRQSGNRFATEWLILIEGIAEQSLLDFAHAEFSAKLCESWRVKDDESPQIFRLQVRVGAQRMR